MLKCCFRSVMTSSWAQGLVQAISDTNNHLISSNLAVVICDKYPKAQHHYLVLPKAQIPTIFHLSRENLPLLEELHLLALNVIETKRMELQHFKLGFHAEPSMQHLHLHVISKDFVSDSLKTKKHWNSFNTQLFLPFEDLCAELKENNCVKQLSKEQIKTLTDTELRCNQCDFKPRNIPKLKEHLLNHYLHAA